MPAGSLEKEKLRFQATSQQHRGCIIPQAVTHSLALLKIGKIIARHMLSWLELLINRYCCIYLVLYITYKKKKLVLSAEGMKCKTCGIVYYAKINVREIYFGFTATDKKSSFFLSVKHNFWLGFWFIFLQSALYAFGLILNFYLFQ